MHPECIRQSFMQRIFRKYLFIIMIIACAILLGVNYFLSGANIRSRQKAAFDTKLSQLVQTFKTNDVELEELEAATDEDYLTRAQAFAYIIQKNSHVLEDTEELKKIAILLGVDELHVSDENGIIKYSSVPKYIGLDYRSGEQMQEFLPLLEDTTGTESVVQKEQPNTAEGKTMKYVGVSRGTPAGIIQIGVKPKRLLAARNRNTSEYIISRIPTEPGENFIAFDQNTGEVLGSTYDNVVDEEHTLDKKTLENVRTSSNGSIHTWASDNYYLVTTQYNDMLICAVIKTSDLYQNRLSSCLITSIYMIILGIILIIFLDRLIDRTVVQGIHQILKPLADIQKGHLETHIRVNSSPELTELSSGINAMVNSLVHSYVRMSKILEMTGISLASFECDRNSDQVIYTSLLPELLKLSPAVEKTIMSNKHRFMDYLYQLQSEPVPEENGIYHVDQNGKSKFFKITLGSDAKAQFGIIMDVTEDIRNKQLIRYEHDHDTLTGLPIYQYFEKTVTSMLTSPEFTGCAAGIMMDLDKFKSVNDTYGHDFGDQYLQHMASKMRELPTDHCFPSRRSGDEFCLFLYGYSSQKELLAEMEKFWKSLAESPIRLPDGTDKILVASAGIAWAEPDITMAHLMYNADVALYKAKKKLPGTYQIFEE